MKSSITNVFGYLYYVMEKRLGNIQLIQIIISSYVFKSNINDLQCRILRKQLEENQTGDIFYCLLSMYMEELIGSHSWTTFSVFPA